ncbi:N-acetylglucosamine-6-phosphate deacetylase [Ramlibacter tataouinensis]|uniref:Candidate N-acetylglucosamine 6-phosphate deacetylase (NagA), Carbohydrate Esterase Family 9 n=1 Tax=Ramlibacter tataouinensis (strain ATCC BAA-407 / DSM 14655 / LMG 21543 / TTB310) TaxID=365046 RepID=F5XW01_RAMTT|nr:N-acetylglucosamine-6-phosphate deacetylase [Ramlibacter tataouinensis]AEG94104.1 candidate N-acetylglucosamine 6-phosphate deacetylase (NagA), Carbohydrate Esterase Family 9 [Ramlibacter tataouinensis TTB310]
MNQHNREHGCVLTPSGWVRGAINFDDRVSEVVGDAVIRPAKDDVVVLPGFVDLHVHGGAGADVMDGPGAIERICKLHARHGTTSLLATTVAASPELLLQTFEALRGALDRRPIAAARLLGVHLEGPYLNPKRLGAQPDCVRVGNIDEVRDLHARAPIRVLTLAPEVAGNIAFVRQLKAMGIVVQCGHTEGTYEEGVAAMMAGAGGFTHLFNAMSPLHHRAPGMVGAALAHAEYAELIPDLLHVHPGAMRVALRAIPHLYCVTDATAAAGMPDGDYQLGGQPVTKCMGGVRLADGTLAGSSLTMDQALRNLVEIGLDLDAAARCLSTHPADYIGERERGRLCAGVWADMVVLTPGLQVNKVYIEGECIELTDA